MAIAFGAVGTRFAGGTNAATPIAIAYPTGITAGQMLLLFVTVKLSTVTVTDPSGWNLIGSFTGGTGASAIDAGTTRTAVYWREATGSESGTVSVAFSATPTGHTGFIVRYTKSAGSAWATPTAVSGADTTHLAAWSVTGSANLSVTTGDLVVLGNGNDTDATTAYTTPTLTATGATISTPTVRLAQGGSASSNDCGCNLYDAPVTAGTSSAAPVHTLAAGPTACGETAFIRLREIPITNVNPTGETATVAESATVLTGVLIPPTFPATQSLVGGTGTRSFPAVTTQAGDWLVVELLFESDSAVSDPALSALSWALQTDSGNFGSTLVGRVMQYTAMDATGGSRAIQVTPNTTLNYRGHITVVRGSDGPGTGKGAGDGQTQTITRGRARSAVFMAIIDWSAGSAGTPVWTPGGATIATQVQSGVATYVVGRWDDAGAVTAAAPHGVLTPTYGTPTMAVLEVQGTLGTATTDKTDSDTASGTDAGTLATALTPATDARTATDAGTMAVTLTPAGDTSSTVESASLTTLTPKSGSDTALMVDVGTLLASFSGTEAGASADAPSGPLSATLAGADTSTRVEAYQLSVVLQSADTGAGADAGTRDIAGVDKSGSETATAVDAATLATSRTGADTAGAADAATLVVNFTASELSSIVDTVQALAAVHTGADTGSQIESQTVNAGGAVSASETSSAVEGRTLNVILTGADTSTATENQSLTQGASKSDGDASSATENRTLTVQLTASEIVTAIEGFTLSAGGNPAGADTSAVQESILLTVSVNRGDTVTSVDQGFLTLLKSGTETSTLVDSASLLAQLTLAEIVAAAEVLAVLTGPQTWNFISADLRTVGKYDHASTVMGAEFDNGTAAITEFSSGTQISVTVTW